MEIFYSKNSDFLNRERFRKQVDVLVPTYIMEPHILSNRLHSSL